MKKILVFILIAAMIVSIVGCSKKTEAPAQSNDTQKKFKVGIVTDEPIDGAQWLRNTIDGCVAFADAHDNVELQVVEGSNSQYFEQQIRALAEDKYDLIFTFFTGMADATLAVAKDFPDIKFAIYDGYIEGIDKLTNVYDFGMDRLEAAYLAGVAAAMTSKVDKVGIIAGWDEPVINKAVAGWQQGLVSVKPEITDYVMYCNSWSDPQKAKELALELVERGCDVLACAASGSTIGAAQAAAETNTLIVTWDTHPDTSTLPQTLELGCVYSDNVPMFTDAIERALAGQFPAGQRIDFGIDTPASYYDILPDNPLSDDVKEAVEKAKNAIIADEIKISPDVLHK